VPEENCSAISSNARYHVNAAYDDIYRATETNVSCSGCTSSPVSPDIKYQIAGELRAGRARRDERNDADGVVEGGFNRSIKTTISSSSSFARNRKSERYRGVKDAR